MLSIGRLRITVIVATIRIDNSVRLGGFARIDCKIRQIRQTCSGPGEDPDRQRRHGRPRSFTRRALQNGLEMRNPYDVLGVPNSASAADIKSAFRKLAKKYHPDQSKEPRAKERFAEIGSAYEILGDEKKRGAFDRGEIDAEGKPRAPQFEGFGFGRQQGGGADFGGFGFDLGRGGFSAGGSIDPDILSELFGSGGRRGGRARSQASRGEDIAVSVGVPLATIANGGSVRVALPTGRTLDATVPAGIEEGKSIRLRGQGQPGQRGGPAGDVIVTIRYAPHPLFKVEGRDLRLDLPVTLYEAVLGGKVRVPTLGAEVEMAVAPGMSGGRVLRLRGKGMPASADHPAGDLLATIRIVLPHSPDPELAELMRKWRDRKPYDPRSSTG
jgi:DnaJ-class molecular chaperone